MDRLDPIKKAFEILGDSLKTLSKGASKHPVVAGICLLVGFATLVMLVSMCRGQAPASAMYCFLALVFVAVIGLVYLHTTGVGMQKDQIRSIGGPKDLKYDTNPFDTLSEEKKQRIKNILQNVVSDVSATLGLSSSLVRSNVFAMSADGRLRICDDLHYNMKKADELTISMPPGYGSTGRCFSTGKPNVAIFLEDWGANIIEDAELKKAHPKLCWIISVPILSEAGKKPMGVLNVDGLNDRKNENELREALSDILIWTGLIAITALNKGNPL